MNFIEFNKDQLKFNDDQQDYSVEIPKNLKDIKVESVQIVNDDGSFSTADCNIEEDAVTITVSLDYPANLRINLE